MAKEKKQDCGWQFPKALEIVKCKEGNKEFMKERPARRPFGNTVLICEYPLDGDAMQEPNARMITWRLAKRAARDFLRVSFMTSAIVTATKADKRPDTTLKELRRTSPFIWTLNRLRRLYASFPTNIQRIRRKPKRSEGSQKKRQNAHIAAEKLKTRLYTPTKKTKNTSCTARSAGLKRRKHTPARRRR